MKMSDDFLQAIETYRLHNRLTQVDLAKKIGTTQSHLSRILKAKRCSERYYHTICDVIGYSESEALDKERKLHISSLFTMQKFKEAHDLSYEDISVKYGFSSTWQLAKYFEDKSNRTDFFFYYQDEDYYPMVKFMKDVALWVQEQMK